MTTEQMVKEIATKITQNIFVDSQKDIRGFCQESVSDAVAFQKKQLLATGMPESIATGILKIAAEAI